MATVYRFIIEEKTSRSDSRKDTTHAPKKTTAKKGRYVSIFGGEKGGVEHNRKLRAINPLFNKATGGYWEKGMRVGRAGLGLITRNTETGKLGISLPAVAIIISFVLQTVLSVLNKSRVEAEKANKQNFKAMENGFSAIHGNFETTRNFWSGALTYNENK